MNPNTTTEYRDLPLAVLTESATNPRRIFEDAALKELAESIRSQGVLSPLLVRPLTDQSFEIVAGARRYRAAKIAEAPTVPVRIVPHSSQDRRTTPRLLSFIPTIRGNVIHCHRAERSMQSSSMMGTSNTLTPQMIQTMA
jgi:ParB family chromosome partitioning protein